MSPLCCNGWKATTVGQLVEPVSRLEPVVDGQDYRLMGVRWYGNGCRLHTETRGANLKTKALTRIEPGDVTYNKMWTSKGAFAVVSAEFAGFHATSEYPLFRPRKDLVDLDFLGHVMRTPQFIAEAKSRCRGSTSRARLNPRNFVEIPVLLPPLAEQKRIAEILGSMDEAIQAMQAVIDQTRKVKQGLLRHLLTRGIGHTRFKETEIGAIPESWKVVGLDDVQDSARQCVLTGPFGAQLSPDEFQDHGVPVLKIGNVQWGYIDLAKLDYVSQEKAEALAKYRIKSGDLLFARQGATTGRNGLADERCNGFLINYHIIRVAVDHERCDPHYLNAYFNSPLLQRQVDAEKTRGTREGVNSKNLRGFRFGLPRIEEQREIADKLRAHDSSIEKSRQTQARLERIKSGLMADLLSGRVRVTVDA